MKYSLGLLVLLVASISAHAGVGIERLQKFSSEMATFKATFVQSLYNEHDQAVQKTEGSVVLKRPGKFRWDYSKPYEQQIVADGERLWIYDTELAQVSVKKTDNALGAAPIGLLSENRPLQDDFILTELGPREGLYWIELEPKVKDTDFQKIYLGLDSVGMRVMELRDSFGQATQIQFNSIEVNVAISDDAFKFTPPPDVDVIGTP